ncbi:MAG TPA: hypothetical protein VLJ21_01200 [Candidatus Binatia bacterium]|nr:hypothetical protein [Candidatus Binatia bacterium]
MTIDQRVKDIVKEFKKNGISARPDSNGRFFLLSERSGCLAFFKKPLQVGTIFIHEGGAIREPHWMLTARDDGMAEYLNYILAPIADKYHVTIVKADGYDRR